MDVKSFDDAWLDAENLVGERIRVRGVVLSGGDTFISHDYASWLAGRRIRIQDDGAIERQLLRVLPAWGGGRFMYHEGITLTGTLRRRGEAFELVTPTECTVTRPGEPDGEPDVVVDVPL